MSDRPLLSIIIVTWNVRELVLTCLHSLQRTIAYPYEVLLVDNASSDGTVASVRRDFPDVHVFANTANAGFAAANNQALPHARGRFVVFLNPDTEIINDPFPALTEYCQRHTDVGCIAPKLLNPDRTYQPSTRAFPTLADQALILLKLHHLMPWIPALRRYQAGLPEQTAVVTDVDQVMGAAMVVPREVLDAIGGFDEAYPNWFEEVDWCTRARRAGYRIVYDPAVWIIHHGGSSFHQVLSVKKHRWLLRGLRRYASKFWPRSHAAAITVLSAISYALTVLQSIVRPR